MEQLKTLLSVSGISRFGTPGRPCLASLRLELPRLHISPWVLRSGSRGDTADAANLEEPPRTILQGFPAFRHRQLAGRRRDEDELFFLEQRVCPLAVPTVRDLPGVLRLLSRVAVLYVWGRPCRRGYSYELDS